MTRERRLSFGGVAALYDRARPSYPAALVEDVLEFAAVGEGDRAVEVGAGTGKATMLFAARGLTVIALEPSAEMAAIARPNCAAFENVTIEETDFERWRPPGQDFRLVFSAQAWHWISPDVRYVAARAALEDGGALAGFWTSPDWERSPLRDELGAAYERSGANFGPDPGPMHPASGPRLRMWGDWKREIEAAPGFAQPEMRRYDWSSEYTTAEYLELLQTHSDHILLEEGPRAALLGAVAEVLDRAGGRVRMEYLTLLTLARAS